MRVGFVQKMVPVSFFSRWDVAFLRMESFLYILLGLQLVYDIDVCVSGSGGG